MKVYRAQTYDTDRKFASDVKSRYGITAEDYEALLEAQGGACAICREPCTTGNRLSVDHDHECCPGRRSCGKCIRGLLCTRCNPGIGYFRDNVELLRRAVAYLEGESSK
ncbi:hypothetical protein GCM10010501_72640 [Streptomyces libani subsp. rufus]|nr:hypothetical protein GCM10010501_72640 [Streptomyces libani subsp. rufus]